MNTQIENVRIEFEQTIGRLLKNLAATPDDKLNWSPSPTSRTPLELAYHTSQVTSFLHGSISGAQPIPPMTTEQMDSLSREDESKPRTREEVVSVVEANAAAYVAWLEGLDDDKLAQTWNSPFGDFPMLVAVKFAIYHAAGHVSQIEYVQTIYGDRVWH